MISTTGSLGPGCPVLFASTALARLRRYVENEKRSSKEVRDMYQDPEKRVWVHSCFRFHPTR